MTPSPTTEEGGRREPPEEGAFERGPSRTQAVTIAEEGSGFPPSSLDEGPSAPTSVIPTEASSSERDTVGTARSAVPESLVDEVIAGHFRLASRLGKPSAFGEVWQAHDSVLDRAVAIKILKRGVCSNSVLERFKIEKQVMARMAHPNIAVVFECGSTGDSRPYLVMELLDGDTLTAYCDTRDLSTAERLHIFIAVCRAVDYAHQIKVVHRDLKPSNIMVVNGDAGATPKVIDFGIAKVIEGGDFTAAGMQTLIYERVGTPHYMSPEQVSPTFGPLTHLSDVYSLGIILYELLTGETPFAAATNATTRRQVQESIFSAILTQPPEPPSARAASREKRAGSSSTPRDLASRRLAGQLRGDLDAIVSKAIQKDPAARYASAAELAEDVARHLRGEAVSARPGRFYRARRFVRCHKAASAVGAAVIIAGSIATYAYFTTHAALKRESIALQKTEEARRQETAAKAVAVVERNHAITARDAADQARKVEVRARGEAEALVNYLLYDLRDQLVPLGRTRLLESISARAELYFEELPASSDNDTLERNRGAMYSNRGLILLAQNRNADAAAAFDQAVGIMERRLAAQPDDSARQLDLARALDGRGLIHLDAGRENAAALAAARETFERQLALVEAHDAGPDEANTDRELLRASTLERLGDVEFRASALVVPELANAPLDAAEARFSQQQKLLLALRALHPEDTPVLQSLAVSLEKSGNIHLARRRPDAALNCFREARELLLPLQEKTPGDLSLTHALVIVTGKLGDAELSTDWPAAASTAADRARRILPHLKTALQQARDLTRLDPLNLRAQRELAAAHQRLGHALRELGRYDEALEHAAEDITIATSLAEKIGKSGARGAELAASRINHGQALLQRALPGDLSAARIDFRTALELLRASTPSHREDSATRRWREIAETATRRIEALSAGKPLIEKPKH